MPTTPCARTITRAKLSAGLLLSALLLGVGVSGAEMPAGSPGPGPGGGMRGPRMLPMPAGPAEEDHGPSELDLLARRFSRPAWAPLPMFRGEVAATPFLHELLESPDATNRALAALILGQIANPNSRALLARHLKDATRAVRVQCGIALACMGDARGLPVCAAALRYDEPWVRYYAVYGLWCLNSPAAKQELRNARRGQGALVTQALDGALRAPFVAPPKVKPLPQGARVSPRPETQRIWEQAADVFSRESDWWWHAGDYEQAIRCHEAGLLLDPTWQEAYSLIAWLQWSLGRNDDAIATLNRGIKAAPKSPDAHFNLGFHYFNLKLYRLAEEPLRKAVVLGGDQNARHTYAHCLEKLGKLKECLAEWSAILKAYPADGPARQNHDRVAKLVDK